jgi:DNA-binding transcriptional LysR family regulator
VTTRFTLRQLEYFVAAAESGSTTEAAERLHVTQSAMSAALTDLEGSLDVLLFVRRRGRGISLTAQGRELLAEARQLLRGADEFASRATDLQSGLTGDLRVGCYETIMPAVLAPLLGAFQSRHPGIRIDFLEGAQDELGAALLEGAVDLAITYEWELPAGLSGMVFLDQVPHVLLPVGHPLAGADAVALHDLEPEPFILLTAEPAPRLIAQTFERAGVSPLVRYRSKNWDHIRALVQLELGYSMFAQTPGPTPRHWHPAVVGRPITEDVPAPPILIVTPQRTPLTRRARAFYDFCFSEGRRILLDGPPNFAATS